MTTQIPDLQNGEPDLAAEYRAAQKARWAVLVLDAWAARNEDDCMAARWNYNAGTMRWECPDHRTLHYGDTPDAARIAAATALVAADPSLEPKGGD